MRTETMWSQKENLETVPHGIQGKGRGGHHHPVRDEVVEELKRTYYPEQAICD